MGGVEICLKDEPGQIGVLINVQIHGDILFYAVIELEREGATSAAGEW